MYFASSKKILRMICFSQKEVQKVVEALTEEGVIGIRYNKNAYVFPYYVNVTKEQNPTLTEEEILNMT